MPLTSAPGDDASRTEVQRTMDAQTVADRTLELRISAEAVIAEVKDRRATYRELCEQAVKQAEAVLQRADFGESFPDEFLERTRVQKEHLETYPLDKVFVRIVRTIRVAQERIDGLRISELKPEHFAGATEDERMNAVDMLLEIAAIVAQAKVIPEKRSSSGIVNRATEILQGKLGFSALRKSA